VWINQCDLQSAVLFRFSPANVSPITEIRNHLFPVCDIEADGSILVRRVGPSSVSPFSNVSMGVASRSICRICLIIPLFIRILEGTNQDLPDGKFLCIFLD
jgi:hypothetical protein